MTQTKWTWKHIQVVSHPVMQDQVMLMCPGPGCEWWYVYPQEFSINMKSLKEYAKAHIEKEHA